MKPSNMKCIFYDIESLDNVFTLCHFSHENNALYVYYLCDDDGINPTESDFHQIIETIVSKNKNINASCKDGHCDIYLRDLRSEEANDELAMLFGLSDAMYINNPKCENSYDSRFRIVCDTDTDIYDESIHHYLAGYNSQNYDTTMLSLYLYESYNNGKKPDGNGTIFKLTTAKRMRSYNDALFTDQFKKNMPSFLTYDWNPSTKSYVKGSYNSDKALIRKNMLMSGRHLDIARLNEKQQHVGLKRLLGMLGYQILESDKLHGDKTHIETKEELFELLAYNASDVINLFWLSLEPIYQGQFALKKGLLKSYPELIYEKRADAYAPNIAPWMVRKDRLTIDSSSAQFATKTLCPYGHLTDIEAVSFLYPAAEKAKELGIPQVDVLEETRKFFYANFHQPELRARFDVIYNYYANIRGKNFNDSKNYAEDFKDNPIRLIPHELKKMPKVNLCLPYFDKNGNPTSCFVTFSTGGIHGAEYNKTLYEDDHAKYEKAVARLQEVQAMYPEPTELKKAKKVTLSDGVTYNASEFLKSGSTMKQADWKIIKEPVLFIVDNKGNYKLHKRYVYTSADPANHEDFTSYYPNLLRMMMAFYNEGLGEDRYANIFFQKQDYGFLMKPKNANLSPENAEKYRHLREGTGLEIEPLLISNAERALYDILRDGTKLILNSASGAGDTAFESNIRMNNQIISMRIIGQLFSWRIGQAQAIAGAKVTSTNTDGLYSVLEATLNNQILERESNTIGVEIEPEPIYLISKDSNNRLEYDENSGKIVSASGGSIGCRKGPNPTKSLSHPAILDWATAEYLLEAGRSTNGLSLSAPFSERLGMEILLRSKDEFKGVKWLIMMQNVLASSPGSITYIFGLTPGDTHVRPHIMQHYNRVFIMKNNTPDTLYLRAAVARKITPAMQKKRRTDGTPAQVFEPLPFSVLNANGVSRPPAGTDVTAKKVTNIEEDWNMYVCNKDLYTLSDDELRFIEDNIDLEKYLILMRNSFTSNWKNHLPGEEFDDTESEEETA